MNSAGGVSSSSNSPLTSVTILFASETGTAEDVSYQLSRAVASTFPAAVHCRVNDIANYDVLELPSEQFVLFVVSTTGDGAHPASMQSFWKFLLRKTLPSDSLANVRAAVLGLGDSSYEKFNATARYDNVNILMLVNYRLPVHPKPIFALSIHWLLH